MKLNARRSAVRLEATTDMLRSEKLNGRDYLVAPVIPLKEGVHNGEFIAFEEIAVFPEAWDGRPLPINHPSAPDGSAITANSPDVMESSVVGFLFNVVAREDLRGISGELWIDKEKAAEVVGGTEVLARLNAGEQLEVSTGYFAFIDRVPGEWQNSDGSVEKYVGTQTSIRPDHLALLPFDIGACNWQDGCGSPRVNTSKVKTDDHALSSKDMKDTNLKVNGKQLGKVLSGVLAAHTDADGTAATMINRLAVAAGIEVAKVEALVKGELDFAPRSWLTIFSAVLDVDAWEIFMAASNDNADARHNEGRANNEVLKEPVSEAAKEEPVAQSHNIQSESVPCGCNKTLGAKIQESVTNALKALGFKGTENKPTEVDTKMTTKERVDALIASKKTQFAESHRAWLETLSEDQLATLEPVAEEAPAAPATNAAAVPEVKPEPKPEVRTEPVTRDQILAAVGLSAADIEALRGINASRKADRDAKIAELAANSACPYDKAELENFSDALLDKTITMLKQSGPYRTAAGIQLKDDAFTVPAAPAILLAKPEGLKKEAK